MSIRSLTTDSTGTEMAPTDETAWLGWVSATSTRNHLLSNTLIDWFNLYGEQGGFVRDSDLPGFDERFEFTLYIMRKGEEFERALTKYLATLAPIHTIAESPQDIRDLGAAKGTFDAMCSGQPVIHQGVLWDAETRTYGAPDFLVRSDYMPALFPDSVGPEGRQTNAPDLGTEPWHYVVVDAKFTTLHLQASGLVGNGGSQSAYKAQVYVYNRALGRLQGHTSPMAYLVGRGWQQTVKGHTSRGFSAMERLGPVPMDASLGSQVTNAADWVRRVRTLGSAWSPLPRPSVRELWPNMKETGDFPWHTAKSRVAEELSDITMVWWVGPPGRDLAHRSEVYSWRDPALTASLAGVKGESTARRLQAILDVNRARPGPAVRPAYIRAARTEWHPEPRLEFYVDFETVNSVNDDFSKLPDQNGRPMIFMIGCGYVEDGEWRYRNFCADELSERAERGMVDEWVAYVARVEARRGVGAGRPRLLHWSFAEPLNFEDAYNSARSRHPESQWPALRWFDCWKNVVRAEPVVVRGALSFGLKAFAKAMHSNGLIETSWGDSQLDGLGAMVGAWACDEEARREGVALGETELMREIVRYNEIDCRVMEEIVHYLRTNH